MDYLNQLLESYNKLKKRKFKLVYINENQFSTEDALNAYNQALQTGFSLSEVPDVVNPQTGQATKANKIQGNIKIIFGSKGVTFSNKEKKEKIPGINLNQIGSQTIDERTPEDQQRIKVSIGYALLGVAPPKEANGEGTVASGVEGATSGVEGGGVEASSIPEPEIAPLEDITKNTLLNSFKKIKKFCQDNPKSPICSVKKLGLSSNTGESFTSEADTGVYGRLQAASKVVFDPELNAYVKDKLEDSNLDIAADAYEVLVNIATKNEDSDCDDLNSSVSLVGKNYILLKSGSVENSEGVLLPIKGKEAPLLAMAMANCPKSIDKIKIETIYDGAKSQVKGALSETTVDFYYLLNRHNDPTISEKERKEIRMFVSFYLAQKVNTIQKIAKELKDVDSDISDVESAFIRQVFEEDALIASNTEELRNFISREMAYQKRVIQTFFPNAKCAYNSSDPGTAKTGDRPDRQFIYTDINAAKQDLIKQNFNDSGLQETTLGKLRQAVDARCKGKTPCQEKSDFEAMLSSGGLVDKPNNTRLYLISCGMKRYKELDAITLGTVASLNRMSELLTENYGGDNRLAEGFLDFVQQKLELDPVSTKELQKLHEDLEEVRRIIQSTILSKYQLDTGKKPDFSDPVQVLNRLEKIIKDKSLKTNEAAKEIVKLIKKASKLKKDENGEYIDKANVLGRVVGKITKYNLINTYKNLLNSKNPKEKKACEDYLVKQLLLCGATLDNNMYQTIIGDDGSTSVIRHNEIFDMLLEAKKAGNLKIEISGIGVTYSFGSNKVQLNMGTKQDTIGFGVKLKKSAILKLNRAKNLSSGLQQTNENIQKELALFKQFFKLQNEMVKLINK